MQSDAEIVSEFNTLMSRADDLGFRLEVCYRSQGTYFGFRPIAFPEYNSDTILGLCTSIYAANAFLSGWSEAKMHEREKIS